MCFPVWEIYSDPECGFSFTRVIQFPDLTCLQHILRNRAGCSQSYRAAGRLYPAFSSMEIQWCALYHQRFLAYIWASFSQTAEQSHHVSSSPALMSLMPAQLFKIQSSPYTVYVLWSSFTIRVYKIVFYHRIWSDWLKTTALAFFLWAVFLLLEFLNGNPIQPSITLAL